MKIPDSEQGKEKRRGTRTSGGVVPEPEKQKPEAQKPAAAKKQQTKKTFDTGKKLALLKAGWSIAKIADEMGVSEPTIYNHMKKEGITK